MRFKKHIVIEISEDDSVFRLRKDGLNKFRKKVLRMDMKRYKKYMMSKRCQMRGELEQQLIELKAMEEILSEGDADED